MKTPPVEAFVPLDDEEKELMDSVENENWVKVENIEKTKEEHAKIAEATFSGSKRINIRITPRDYHMAQAKALEEGRKEKKQKVDINKYFKQTDDAVKEAAYERKLTKKQSSGNNALVDRLRKCSLLVSHE